MDLPQGALLPCRSALANKKKFHSVQLRQARAHAGTSRLQVEGEAPPSRAHHSATLIGNKLYIWGGYGGHGRTYADLWILDFGTFFTVNRPNTCCPAPASGWHVH